MGLSKKGVDIMSTLKIVSLKEMLPIQKFCPQSWMYGRDRKSVV